MIWRTEIPTALLVHPRYIDWDGPQPGRQLDPQAGRLTLPGPWSWSVTPAEPPEGAPVRWSDWFEGDRAYRLTLVAELGTDITEGHFTEQLNAIFAQHLPALFVSGVVDAYAPEQQQAIWERVSLPLPDPALPALAALAVGLYRMRRERETAGESWLGVVLDQLHADVRAVIADPAGSDVLAAVELLLEAWHYGVLELDGDQVHGLLTGPGHIASYATNHRRTEVLAEGQFALRGEQLAAVRPEDLEILRRVGVDTVFQDVLMGIPQAHLHPRRLEAVKQAQRTIPDLVALQAQVNAACQGETDAVHVPLAPLPHSSDDPSIVFGHLWRLKFQKHPRYPGRFFRVSSPHGQVNVVFPRHVFHLGRDLARLVPAAIAAGEAFLAKMPKDPAWGDKALRKQMRALMGSD